MSFLIKEIISTLDNWIKMVSPVSVVADASVNFSLALKQMNNDINYLRSQLNTLREEYNRIQEEQEVDPLMPSLQELPLMDKLEMSLAKARSIAYAYNQTLDDADNLHINVTTYLSPRNRQAIDRLFAMTVDDLLSLFKDAHLLGF